jgi:hypothetical protein
MNMKNKDAMPNYYMVSFRYRGPTANCPDCSEAACEALDNAERIVTDICNLKFLDQVHAYSWTDGSLYRYFRSALDQAKFKQKLRRAFDKQEDVSVVDVEGIIDAGDGSEPSYPSYQEAIERFKCKDRKAP